jgi:GntR family transcriptional regulator/MocR family aminotransferase
MDLHVRLEGRQNLAHQIYDQIRKSILDGRLARGARVPPTRELAQRLAVSRNTVSIAYEWLVAEGLLSGRKGAGSFVSGEVSAATPPPRADIAIRHRPVWDTLAPPEPNKVAARFDFGVGMPDGSLFPFDAWRRLLARQIRPSRLNSDYGDPAGHPGLRQSIARHIGVSRGVKADADDVIVTNGAQQAFDLIARVLIQPGSAVAIENPGYPPVRMLFESMDARVVPIRVDDSGLDVASLPNDVRLVYVTPSHQFPLGMPMSHARRTALLEWAERRNAVIIEDDYDSEFRFGGRPLDTLQSIDRHGRVIYVGSFSKSLLPALRLGFLIAPPSLRHPLRAASHVASWYPQWPAQAALSSFIDEGLLARHLRKMRRIYAERHDMILHTLITDFSDWLRPIPAVTGIHIAATLRRPSRTYERDVAALAAANDVAFDRLTGYWPSGRAQPGIVLGYGGIATSEIAEGLSRLRRCFEGVGGR